jgi:hypothetical protein
MRIAGKVRVGTQIVSGTPQISFELLQLVASHAVKTVSNVDVADYRQLNKWAGRT